MHTEYGWETRLECFDLKTIWGREYYVKENFFGNRVLSDKHETNVKCQVSNAKELVVN